MRHRLDDIDFVILDRLQGGGRVTRTQLAAIVRRSVPAVSERMRRLEREGVILGFHATVDPRRLGYASTAFAWVSLHDERDEDPFVAFASRRPDVLEIHAIAGGTAYLLKIRTRTSADLRRSLASIQEWPGVQDVAFNPVVETHRETRRLPVQPGANAATHDHATDWPTAFSEGP